MAKLGLNLCQDDPIEVNDELFTGDIYIYDAGTKDLSEINALPNPLHIKDGIVEADCLFSGEHDIIICDHKGKIVNTLNYEDFKELPEN